MERVLESWQSADKLTLSWSPSSEVVWTYGTRVLKYFKEEDETYKSLNDVSVLMRSRALSDYGLCKSYAPEEEPLIQLWNWIELTEGLDDYFTKGCKKARKLIGIRDILGSNADGKIRPSEKIVGRWADTEEGKENNLKDVYNSEERLKALYLCQWLDDWDGERGIEKQLDKLEMDGKFTTAAALAVFNLNPKRAIDSLTKAAASPKELSGDPSLTSTAMALSGFKSGRNNLWRETCKTHKSKLNDPYLQAIFSFLTTDDDSYSEILNDTRLRLAIRVGFACKYLSDEKLAHYLHTLNRTLVEKGDLEGLLLVGTSKHGLDLLQRYLENTSDIQSVALIILHSLPYTEDDIRPNLWVDRYKELLDCWLLWHKRALFDIEWHKRSSSKTAPPQQLYINCHFCGQSVSSHLRFLGATRGHNQKPNPDHQPSYGRVSVSAATNKARIHSCPSCRKPLPRCCLCLTQLGTPAGARRNKETMEPEEEAIERKLSPFSTWFTSCQSCRHGGHANHLNEWFKEHLECPVSGCNCKCVGVDHKIANISVMN